MRALAVTYCAGWKHKGSVYLLANTVAAMSIAPSRRQISLGELLTDARPDVVEEASLKLVRIAPGTAVACLGDEGLAAQIFDFLRAHGRDAASNAELLALLACRSDLFDEGRSAELLLASSSSDGSAELLHWSSQDGLSTAGSDFQQIGRPMPFHAALSPDLLSILAAGDLASDRVLPVIAAIVQSQGVRGMSIDLNADGLVFGLRTESGTVTWQEDTLVIVYDQAFACCTHVAVLARDDELVVHSSENNATRVCTSPTSMRHCPTREIAWLRDIQAELTADRYRYRTFISTSENVITLIIRSDFDRESRYLRLNARGYGQFDLAFSPELTALLLSPMHEKNRAIPLRLSVRED